jgi:hypothetical protein
MRRNPRSASHKMMSARGTAKVKSIIKSVVLKKILLHGGDVYLLAQEFSNGICQMRIIVLQHRKEFLE